MLELPWKGQMWPKIVNREWLDSGHSKLSVRCCCELSQGGIHRTHTGILGPPICTSYFSAGIIYKSMGHCHVTHIQRI